MSARYDFPTNNKISPTTFSFAAFSCLRAFCLQKKAVPLKRQPFLYLDVILIT